MIKLEKNYWKKFPIWKDVSRWDWEDWKWQIKNRIRSISQLEEILGIDLSSAKKVEKVFRTGTTPYYLSLVKDLSDLSNPILKQILPSCEEIDPQIQSEGSFDPFKEEIMSPVKGLTHRYPDRVLFRVTTFCSVYCRHCMRKRIFLEEERAKKYEDYIKMINYIRENPAVKEVLISGGDPLTLPNRKLEFILEHLSKIEHVEIIRIGTRELVVNPYRFFDDGLLELLNRYDKLWIVTHFNHPDEVTDIVKKAVRNILSTGTPVLNQAVLLKDINDSPNTIENLMRSLLHVKIKPYYLFYCDPTKGVLHFRTDIKKGVEILEHLRGNLSGIGIPTYAVDLPGGLGKIPLTPEYVLEETDEYILLKSPYGKTVKINRHNSDIINNHTKKQEDLCL
ncbi:MAG: KamA family radical SAM protein [Persephonella sp.]|nr:KamA family radical SAM protein [Persephonella sp.]